ncbi:hypothetical protein [Picrophilus oshimae]|uniref:Hypothetical membrane protein n=1 Tax=Picrophilus torridus (strain ATCC 700027 / DSM 9790 / JCM 10055 / NBRC 100828 / KAW 2/3) TaxID=1122961 RepID=Q6L0C6_PICTO|nr:hypothetical protein [Picrophilus oshimae]AAT43576.1 hypothetical membrane protein [Picrophilus oshimae DSM 9789]SMD31200.1 hypothetical protein SAMN02745355_1123 [Picrophilus oshimae DSM 9789]
MIYPSYLEPYQGYITLVLVFVDGLLFGMVAKKAIVAVVLLVVALIIASFIDLSFIPHISAADVISNVTKYASTYASDLHLQSLTITFFLIVFIIGLGIGIWKG